MINKKVSLDTQIMIWGIKKQATPTQIEMIEKAIRFIDKLDKERARIIIPAVVIGELLSNVPQEKYQEVLDCLTSNFQVQPFDFKSALLYANRFYEYKQKNNPEAIFESDSGNRQKIKADLMIVASAKSADVGILYSNDNDIIKYSEGFISAKNMPEVSGQLSLLPPVS